jgi:hypothetical protein
MLAHFSLFPHLAVRCASQRTVLLPEQATHVQRGEGARRAYFVEKVLLL